MADAPKLVRIEYEIKVKGGDVLESSEKTGPLEFIRGQGRLLPALEEKIATLKVGEEAKGILKAAEAFGNEKLLPITEILRKEFPKGEKIEVGRIFEARAAANQIIRFKIVEVTEDKAKARFLHPLADKDLEYRVKVLAIDVAGARKPPPPMPAAAIGIDSGAIEILSEDK